MPERRDAVLSRWVLPGFAGIGAVALGLGVAELSAALVAPTASPVFVVGSLLIDWAPAWAKETAISLFGTGDKAALLTGIGIALLLVSAASGILERAKSPWGRVVIGAGGVFGVGAAISRAGAGMLDIVPAAIATIVALIVLGVLLRRQPEERAAPADPVAVLDRRKFLGWVGGATALGALTALGGYALEAGARAATAVRNAFTLPAASVSAPPVPVGAELGIPGLSPVITPNAAFYRIDTALQVPQIDPTGWSVKITGMVDNPVELSWAELIALPLEESVTTIMCVSNEVGGDLIGTAKWLGYPIRHLLSQAKPQSGADMVLSRSQDGFTAGTPIAALLEVDRNAIFAVGMNGAPLPAEHGFPVRMIVPGLYGYVSATKWVVELEVTSYARSQAYWTQRGWGAKGPIKIASRIDVPRQGTTQQAGTVTVAGVAWYQHEGIGGVQVQIDEGPWADATLADAISIDSWVQWRYAWTGAATGTHTVRTRARSVSGELQTAAVAGVLPDGATGYHEISLTIA